MSEHRLSEIVIERPRSGLRISSRKLKGFKKQLNQLTEEASQDGLLSPHLIKPRNKTKYLSDHLGPLRRFLRSQIGQPWDAVYSKLCQQLDHGTMAGQHVLSHVWDYVELHVELINGMPYRRSRRHCSITQGYGLKLYVHPETGLLCDAKAIRVEPTETLPEQPDVITIDTFHQYHRIHEVWYLITYQEIPATGTVFDVLHRVTVTVEGKKYGRQIYAAYKRQCNKREIRRIQQRLN